MAVRSRWWIPGLLTTIAVLVLASASPGSAQDDRRFERTNPFVSPRYSQWLMGAVGDIATEAERSRYLRIESDEAAQEFIDHFWDDRETTHAVFEQRAAEVDKRFTEGTVPGRRTDRGAIYILYGDPEETSYEEHRNIDDPPVELWRYPKSADPGLDGQKPLRSYRFIRWGDVTVRFQKGDPNDPDVRRRRRPNPIGPLGPF
jgi:GWxTD domain-containing protein